MFAKKNYICMSCLSDYEQTRKYEFYVAVRKDP